MNGVIENMIERYIRFPDTLDSEICQELERFLRESAFAKAVAALHREFYEELDGLEVNTSPLLEDFVSGLFALGEGEA